ncbi:MAG: GAF domain-containing protein [Elusimicrobia bacterium]|nr:GAF domain-containing protein [Elusimicrobiota bacterium]
MAFWMVAALCAVLLGALWRALSLLQELRERAASPGAAAPAPDRDSRLTRRLDALLALKDRGQAAAGEATREAFCRAVLAAACEALGGDSGAVWVFDAQAGGLRALAASGRSGAGARPSAAAGRAFESGASQRGGGAGEPFAAVPLIALSKPLGALEVYRAAKGAPLDEADQRFLALLAREAALALHQLELLETQESFSIEMLQVLARAAEEKDQTQGRSERSRGCARRVAEGLGLSQGEVRHVEYAAMLHHVGKIGVDQALLSKPGKLSPNEYAQIKRYTTIGHEILSRAKALEPVARIVLRQQEWFNGKGYPDGLAGDAIPIGSRIVAVVNAWEAMMQDRPYRKALTPEAAFAELRKGGGTQFDPAVVEAFLKVGPEAAAPRPA